MMKMNSYILIIILFMSSHFVMGQTIEFEKVIYELGDIDLTKLKDSVVYYDFKFKNTGDAPLQIKSILSSCGCLASEWSKQSYAPGSMGFIRLSYRPFQRREKKVTLLADVYTNSKGKAVHNLRMSANLLGDRGPLKVHYTLERENNQLTVPQVGDIYEIILDRVIKKMQSGYAQSNDKKVEQLVATIRIGGYWEHIDYKCYFRTNWEPIKHLSNVKLMALAYVTPKSAYFGSSSLFNVINDALIYWNQVNPRSHNWWFNQIGGSQELADVLVLLSQGNKQLSKDLFNGLCMKLKQSDPFKWTGANKLDIAKHHLYRGCLLKNDSIVKVAAQQSFYPIHITRKEGIQEDMSYQQHGAQLYLGGYGIVFSAGISEVAYLLRNTPYALKKEKLEIFSRFLREGFFQVFRGGAIDWSVTGRGISREGIIISKNLIPNPGVIAIIDRMIIVDTVYKDFYLKARKRFSEIGEESYGVEKQNVSFWRSDYMVHNRPAFQATIRTASTRCRKTESGNGENLLGTFLSDGAFTIRQKGDEYLNVFPVWEWDKIPGVTSVKKEKVVAMTWGAKGHSKLTAGVSNGVVGAYAYMHDDHDFKAVKSWFLLDDMVVALGVGISADNQALHTTLDQSHLRSIVEYKIGRQIEEIGKGKVILVNPEYILHNNMAYVPLEDGELVLKASDQKGNWVEINYNERNEELELPIFNLIWEHPKGTQEASYSYIQLPSCRDEKQIKNAKESITFVNSQDLQAVYCKKTECAMALFYKKGEYRVGKWSISVDKPALLLIEGLKNKQPKIEVVNPMGDSSEIVVEVKYKNDKISKCIPTFDLKSSSF